MNHSRRKFLQMGGMAGTAFFAENAWSRGEAQSQSNSAIKSVDTTDLTIGYEDSGDSHGFPIILLHGFPDDIHAWDEVVPPLVKAGHRVLVPYLRGFGPTRLRNASVPRMAEQAAIGQDLIDFADALGIARFAVAGYDWGCRAACVTAALHRDRIRAALLIGGYTIQDVSAPPHPESPEIERAHWYQWYFNSPRGRIALESHRRSLCKFLWKEWSPTWNFSDDTFERTAASFDNPDFVDLVVHSYRHRNSNAPGDPRFAVVERQLSRLPQIHSPSIILRGADDGVNRPPADLGNDRIHFPALAATRVVQGAGHFVPRETPDIVVAAILELMTATR
jgi:pimeloyl-ACP methyl ester carboxylesterase